MFFNRVVIAARTINKLEETVLLAKDNQEVTKGEIYPIAADVSKEEDCKKLVNIAIEKLGGIDILILNAAYSPQPLFFNETQNPVSEIATFIFTLSYIREMHF